MKILAKIFGTPAVEAGAAALQSTIADLTEKLKQAGEAAATAGATIADLTAKLEAADVKIQEYKAKETALDTAKAEADAKAKAADAKSEKLDDIAAQGAVEIAAGQGGVPVPLVDGAGNGGAASEGILEQFAAIKDPIAKARFQRANQTAIDAAIRETWGK